MHQLVELDILAVLTDAMGPAPRDDEKILPLLKKFRAVGAGFSWIPDTLSGENVRIVEVEHTLSIKTEWTAEEDFNLPLGTIFTRLVRYKSLRPIKFYPIGEFQNSQWFLYLYPTGNMIFWILLNLSSTSAISRSSKSKC